MLLFARRHVAGAHHAALVLPALADADAAQDGAREAAVVVRILEVRCGSRGSVIDAEPQVVVHAIWVHQLAGIHLAGGIPDALELAERLDQLWPEHQRQELGARLAVAVLAGERPAVAHAELRALAHERAGGGNALGGFQVEIDARMHAALPQMPVERTVVTVAVREGALLAQISPR